MNDVGQVVGTADVPGGATHAFLWTAAGGMIDLGDLGGSVTAVVDIDADGLVAGQAEVAGVRRAFGWTEATGMVDLGDLGGPQGNALAVDGGRIVGHADTPNGATHAFVWTAADGMVDLGGLDPGPYASNAFAYAIAGDRIAGLSTSTTGHNHATLWEVLPAGPIDADLDGIDDAIDTGAGTFVDAGTTAGSLGAIPASVTVSVTDLADPDGVRVVVGGSGSEPVVIAFTNPMTGVSVRHAQPASGG